MLTPKTPSAGNSNTHKAPRHPLGRFRLAWRSEAGHWFSVGILTRIGGRELSGLRLVRLLSAPPQEPGSNLPLGPCVAEKREFGAAEGWSVAADGL